MVPRILHQSTIIQGNSPGALFKGLLAELPAFLDSFFTSTTSDYIGVVGRGWWGAMNRCCVVMLFYESTGA